MIPVGAMEAKWDVRDAVQGLSRSHLSDIVNAFRDQDGSVAGTLREKVIRHAIRKEFAELVHCTKSPSNEGSQVAMIEARARMEILDLLLRPGMGFVDALNERIRELETKANAG